jgi:serine protease Do
MDIALLQLPDDRDWPHLQLADSDEVAVGDWVLAVGNPLGLGMTVTAGIISGKGRVLGNDIFGNEDFLQTDAAINPGNSGGPLVDLHGRVVGMNTAIIAGANTVGFSIPTNLIRSVLDDLRDNGHVARGFLGVNSQPLTPELAEALGVDARGGAVVASIFPGTPAADAGLERGDVVIEVDGTAIDDQVGLVAAIGNHRPGDAVGLTVLRGAKKKRIEVTLAERPGEDQATPRRGATETLDELGLVLAPLTPPVAAQKGVGEGVLVERVDRDGPASGRLRPGDVILQVNRKNVDSPEAVAQILGRSTGTAFLVVLRGDAELFVTVPLP